MCRKGLFWAERVHSNAEKRLFLMMKTNKIKHFLVTVTQSATATHPDAGNQVYNVAFGERTTLNELFVLIRDRVQALRTDVNIPDAVFRDFRPGDVRHSLADIGKAGDLLGYGPKYSVREGLDEAAAWYVERLTKQASQTVGAAS
jgi:UDP-glucose 4-epimerase